jgi:hypothetical protein
MCNLADKQALPQALPKYKEPGALQLVNKAVKATEDSQV